MKVPFLIIVSASARPAKPQGFVSVAAVRCNRPLQAITLRTEYPSRRRMRKTPLLIPKSAQQRHNAASFLRGAATHLARFLFKWIRSDEVVAFSLPAVRTGFAEASTTLISTRGESVKS